MSEVIKEKPHSVLLLIAGILSLIPALPVLDGIFPLFSGSGSDMSFWIQMDTAFGTFDIDAWTLIPLPGLLWALIFIILGILLIVVGLNAFLKFLPVEENVVPLGLSALVGIVSGAVLLVFFVLLFITEPDMGMTSIKTMGMDMEFDNVGLGLYMLIIGGILALVGGILAKMKS